MSTNRKPFQKKEIDTYDDSFDTACKTDRFVSCHSAKVAKTE